MYYKVLKSSAILFSLLILANCAALPKPFEHGNQKKKNELVALKSGGAIRVEIDQDLPDNISKPLSKHAVKALISANLPASANPKFFGEYILKGFVIIDRPNEFDPEKATFVWKLMISGGGEIGVFEQTIQGDEAGWLSSDPKLFSVIAEDAGNQLASRLLENKSLSSLSFNALEGTEFQKINRNRITKIYFSDFSGATGDGNLAILRSLKYLVKREPGYLVSNKKEANFLVKGFAQIGNPINQRSDLAITWVVTSGGGKKLGEVTQNNNTDFASLDMYWGEAAFRIANGALLGIKNIVDNTSNYDVNFQGK